MISLLDANILIDVGKSRLVPRLIAAAAARPWQLTEEVFDELGSDVVGRASLKPLVRPSPMLDSPEAELSAVIAAGGSGWKSLGVGEASSIAAAAFEPNFEFIT